MFGLKVLHPLDWVVMAHPSMDKEKNALFEPSVKGCRVQMKGQNFPIKKKRTLKFSLPWIHVSCLWYL